MRMNFIMSTCKLIYHFPMNHSYVYVWLLYIEIVYLVTLMHRYPQVNCVVSQVVILVEPLFA